MSPLPLPHVHRGKVRDLYAVGEDRLLMVASDRLSAFDVVMAEPVPDKGRVLTAMSAHWFAEIDDVIGNHLISTDVADLPAEVRRDDLAGRIMLCRRAEMLPVECIVRGFVAGSAWKEYRDRGTIHGMAAPAGLVEADRLPEPIFTPSTKAAVGDHDENITFDRAVEILGGDVADAAREASLAIFARASERAEAVGFLLADTKFELGWVPDPDGTPRLVLADEVLTPDSSRYWAMEDWNPGATPQGFDKQPVRDYLESLGWDKLPPPPALPAEVVDATATRYRQAYERICGRSLDDWPGGPAS
ncbi:MAG TPA: phosphoribosylaminoimidazolesuccinocarboxamide synthase [Microthrixaceae bacterium]|nr:phosphoribosylaminoimidazolesuccinocarboxamide synthase [Microthrixaceae bacterium]MCB9401014.1 phosphoribosylaminoimidazolesuccinocarboxamide synthase [Microthrixaceae bacterium]MCO5305256.1 phosphoribosylaminoimidazolesuccinocarboxamide synthase [Microthrixaceae bacterium]HMU79318.1 phosphoribosylaminoimidazolesuccinocarboxamide synthase [Microthrixaceae bacterium]HMV73547.1 phosphoribosylaminoimidazolesuccinocarboxamide synthase [Microthrixaceae bacterium]